MASFQASSPRADDFHSDRSSSSPIRTILCSSQSGFATAGRRERKHPTVETALKRILRVRSPPRKGVPQVGQPSVDFLQEPPPDAAIGPLRTGGGLLRSAADQHDVGRIEAKPVVRLRIVEPSQGSGTAAGGILELLGDLVQRTHDLDRLACREQQRGCLVLRGQSGVSPSRRVPTWTLRDRSSGPRGRAGHAGPSSGDTAATEAGDAAMSLRRAFTAVVLAVVAAASAPGLAGASGRPVRMNEIQVIGTHNSYHRELSQLERAAHDAIYGGAPIYENLLAYSHASVPNQLRRQGVRGLELDLYPDPEGGRYANPLLRRWLAAGPLTDPEWYRPGIKVIHTADLDYNSTCVRLVGCLRLVRRWSRANPGHVPLLILLELKATDPVAGAVGGVSVPPWDRAALDALDAEIRSVFPPRELITPDFVRRRGLTLERSVLGRWPPLRRVRGRVMFLIGNEPGTNNAADTGG